MKAPTHVSLMRFSDLATISKTLLKRGCVGSPDAMAGTATIKDGDEVVLKALKKGGRGSPWIASFYDTANFKWEKRDHEMPEQNI